MSRRILYIFLLFLITLMIFISCKTPIPPYIKPELKDVAPFDSESGVALDEPLSFDIESYGRQVNSVYLYLSETSSFLNAVPQKLNRYEYIPNEGWSSDQTYYWKLKIVEETGETLTKAYHFTTIITAQYQIELLTPVYDATAVSTEEKMQWDFKETARTLSPEFLVYVSEDKSTIMDVTPVATDGAEYLPVGGWKNDATYYWMVKAVDKSNPESVYATSVISQFKTINVQPGYPQIKLLSPLDGQIDVLSQTPVRWQGVPYDPLNQLEYKVFIANSIGDLDYVQPIITSDEEYLPNTGWAKGKRYYWKVQACEGDKCSTDGPRMFVTKSKGGEDPEIKVLYPEDGASGIKLQTPLTYVATPSENNPDTLHFNIYMAHTLQALDTATPVMTYDYSYLPVNGWEDNREYFWKVQAVQGIYTDVDGPRNFHTEIPEPLKPEIHLEFPAYGSKHISTGASMTWNATSAIFGESLIYNVYYATSYEDLNHIEPVITEKEEFLPKGGWGKGKRFFWKVKVIEDQRSDESGIWDFFTEEKSHSDPDILLIAPSDGQSDVSVTDFLQWEGVPGTIGEPLTYNLYIAYSRTELEKVMPIPLDSQQYRPVNGWEYDKRYFWKCEVVEGDKKAISEVRDFITESKPSNIPSIELISPHKGAVNVERMTELEWRGTPAVQGESLTYRIYYAKTLSDLDHVQPIMTSEEQFLQSGGWEYATTYYWKCVVVEGEQSNVSEIRWFTVKDGAPDDPEIELLTPLNDSTAVDRKEALRWKGTPGMSGDSLTYKVYFAKSLSELNHATGVHTVNEQFLPTGGWEYDNKYYWKCEVIEGDKTNISDIFTFRTRSKNPDDPSIVLISPENDEESVSSDKPMEWLGTPGTQGDSLEYVLYVANTLSGLVDATGVHTTEATYLLPGGWKSGCNYYWRCEIIEGSKTDISDVWHFTTKSDEPEKPLVSLSTPENGSINFELDGMLIWEATSTNGEDLRYTLFMGNEINRLDYQINLSTKYYQPIDNWEEEKQYYWKIRAYEGERYNETDIWNFTTGRGSDFEIKLESPASGTADVDIYTPLTWIATENIITSATPVYSVYIAKSPEQLDYVHPYETREESFLIPAGRWEYDETYYWKVAGYDGAQRSFDGPSTFRTRSEITVPPSVDLLQPATDSTDVDPAISFRWKGHYAYVRTPLVYEVYIALNQEDLYTSPPATILNGYEIYIPENNLDINTTYFWRVKVNQGTMTGDATASFTTRNAVYEIPEIVLLTPENGATGVEFDSSLTWEASGSLSRGLNNRSESIDYRVYVADNLASMSNHDYIYNEQTTDKSFTPPADWGVERSYVWTADIYYYVDGTLVASNTADPHSFTTKGLLPATATSDHLIPEDDKTNVSIYTQLDWGIGLTAESATPTYFEIYMDTVANPTTMIGTSLFTTYQPEKLATGTDYYWKVISVNPLGTAEGPEWHFKTRNDTLSKTTDVVVQGNYVYAAEQENGVSVYHIPSASVDPLELRANISFSSLVNGVTVEGSYLYASIGSGGVEVYNISNPENPFYVSSIDDEGYCIASEVLGDYLYLANGFNGSSVDISDINNPDNIGRIEQTNDASGSVIDLVVDTLITNTMVYMADGVNGLTVADVTLVATPVTVATGVLDLPENVESVGIDKKDEYVYIVNLTRSENDAIQTDSGNGLMIVNTLQLQNPVISQVNTSGFAKDVDVKGDYAYIADGKQGLAIVDCSNPALPVLITPTATVAVQANAVYVVGTIAYVAGDENGVICIDCSDPENQVRIH